ncbi:virulence protein, SciE type [Caballeronia pedi]|uniref:Virulence protein, SciE type n=1 Tax=Caballeronia pedi TaxID=1777141 RepID=A0A157ZVF4_9BURK|nr:type VI secretion system accessory protein TagJ [Caballeronia pedi]SAK49485.1 virulence protein, SciE type [Caballeronia pedi]
MNLNIASNVAGEGITPEQAIEAAEAKIRKEPAAAAHRWVLFQWLCITQQWARAIQQLQAFAQLGEQQDRTAHLYRDLVRAERVRGKVMAGAQEPGFVFDGNPAWMHGLHAALGLAARGHIDEADAARETALDAAPLVSGAGSAGSFDWIGDSDTRLGPVCEFVAAGRYRWISLADIAAWRIARPVSLVDLIWAPATLTLADGTPLNGFMPARYPEMPAQAARERDALLLGRRTVWHDIGRTGVIASGCKTWATSAGDFGVFDLAQCTFGNSTHAHVLDDADAASGAVQ